MRRYVYNALKSLPEVRDCVKLLIEDILSNPTKWRLTQCFPYPDQLIRDNIIIQINGRWDSAIFKDRETINMNPAEAKFCSENLKKFKKYREEDVDAIFSNKFSKLK